MSENYQRTSRKKHKNSRLGCATCKRRRIKCSETLPECTNCVKHGSRCDYLEYCEEKLREFEKIKQEYSKNHFPYKHDTINTTKYSKYDPLIESKSASSVRPQKCRSAPIKIIPAHTRPYLSVITSNSPTTSSSGTQNSSVQSSVPRGGTYTKVFEGAFNDNPPTALDISDRITSKTDNSSVTPDYNHSIIKENLNINPLHSTHNSVVSHWSYNLSSAVSCTPRESESEIIDNRESSDTYWSDNSVDAPSNCSSSGARLPFAKHCKQTFCILRPKNIDFDKRFDQLVTKLGPSIILGKAQLQQIRELNYVWLGQSFLRAFESGIMFSCLANSMTNYLLVNIFREPKLTIDTSQKTDNTRKGLLACSFQHFASVIENLRLLIIGNTNPQLASSVSYILSLMSIYDPEATLNSTLCFRDGMFSVLNHTLQSCKSKGYPTPIFIPIHWGLVSNIMRTIYFPAYNSSFLNEYGDMLLRFGSVISSIKPVEVSNKKTFNFIVEFYNDLKQFCQESVKVHIPTVNKNLANISIQLEVLFHMIRKWINLGESRLSTVSRSTDPLEKVLYLFFRLFRKAGYLVAPQIKFCFLRDFDSPLMSDIFPNSCVPEVLHLDTPEKLCLIPEAYARVLHELKFLSAYAIRVITFANLRIAFLYKNLVYNENIRRLYPIKNVVDWRASITDIHSTRTEFQERIGLREVCIERFNTTTITQLHYPRIVEPGAENDIVEPAAAEDKITVDLFSLQPNGLLKDDEMPLPSA